MSSVGDIEVLLGNVRELDGILRNPIVSSLSRRAIAMQMGDCISDVIERCFDLQSDLATVMEETSSHHRISPSILTPVTHYSTPPPNNGDVIRAAPRRARPDAS